MPGSDVTVTVAFKAIVIEPSYIITIPATVDLNDAASMTIVADVENMDGKQLEVNVTSANNYNLVNGTNVISYRVAAQRFTFTQDGSFVLGMTVDSSAGKPAGEYSDTLTFTANVKSVSAGE